MKSTSMLQSGVWCRLSRFGMTRWPSIPCRISACTTQAFLRQVHSLLSQGRWVMAHQTRHGSPFSVQEKANTARWWHPIHHLPSLFAQPSVRWHSRAYRLQQQLQRRSKTPSHPSRTRRQFSLQPRNRAATDRYR
ncbi:hypothetical protein CKAH01_14724 [Colletotrichum kahawae]|uniref:Uncharacterized protein n=1 Tax=Colletotrichum kahawae TaxID=34407 RepID=A0AAE0D986_COLKA|nr:hypothetical protein CKAH01_14724 [Colletotrichum kahawae]